MPALHAQSAPAADPAIAPVVAKPSRPRPPRPAAAPQLNPSTVYLDPAHGGADPGAKLGENALEKDITLAAADKLAAALLARGFTVVRTRTAAADDLATDARIDLANRSHAGICLLVHASAAGKGVHLYSSSLRAPVPNTAPKAVPDDPNAIQPIATWDSAQAAYVTQSQRLAGDVASAVNAQHLPLVLGRSAPRPLDALACPAIALELAPYAPGDDPKALTVPSDSVYQQHVAEAVATALTTFRARLQTAPTPAPIQTRPLAPAKAKAPQPTVATQPSTPTPRPAAKPKPFAPPPPEPQP